MAWALKVGDDDMAVVALQQFHSMRRIFQWADKHCALESAPLGSGLQGCRADFI
jgi:hypothetical protein